MKLALQVLGLMCDGQYRLMQNYLREQRDNIHTINLVGDVALFIQHFYHDINVETVELVHLILQTLIETCVGNYPNQAVIFNRQILEALNSIFRIDIADGHGGYTEHVEDVSGPPALHIHTYTHHSFLFPLPRARLTCTCDHHSPLHLSHPHTLAVSEPEGISCGAAGGDVGGDQ